MFSTASQDMTAAWYAAAPPPPPPPPAKDRRTNSGGASLAIRSSSSSISLSFDKRALGDNLPVSSYAPEPERPVSRNAMARQRERERQRTRSNSNLGQEYITSANVQQSPIQQAHNRTRHDSSPVMPVMYVQQPAGEAVYAPVHYQSPPHTHEAYSQHPPHILGPSSWSQPAYAPQEAQAPVHAPIYSSPQTYSTPPQHHHIAHGYVPAPPAPVSSPHQACQYGYGLPQTIEPQTMTYGIGSHPGYPAHVQPPSTPSQWSSPSLHSPQVVEAVSPQMAYQIAAVPFPSKSMHPPTEPGFHGYGPSAYSTPPASVQQYGRRPLPSTSSRTSSQSSSVGTRASTASLGSMSGTVRRSLPQPPTPLSEHNNQAAGMAHATVKQTDVPASLGRHESVRMAAEEIMSRGPPRRRAGIPSTMMGARTNAHTNVSRSDGSITEATIVPCGANRSPYPASSPAARARAESTTCVEKEMRAMAIDGGRDAAQDRRSPFTPIQPTTSDMVQKRASVPIPTQDAPVRAASPRPMRAAPAPAPEVTIAAPIEDVIPRRPLSRGPKDDEQRRRSTGAAAAAQCSFDIRLVHSPPPNDAAPVPVICFDEPEQVAAGIPQIVLPGAPEIQVTGDETVMPTVQIACPGISISDEYDGGFSGVQGDAEKPTGTISISVSSSNVAQHSTTSDATVARSIASATTRSRYAEPEPASAPSVGSGAACATCQKWITGKVVHAMSHTFHPDCFVCFHCSEHLEHVAFYEHDGRAYCHFDFHELFSKRCFHCRTPIVDQRYITINDAELVGNGGGAGADEAQQERCYHDTHFFCANCGDPFLDPKLSAGAGLEDDALAHVEEDGRVTYGGREFVVHKGYPYCEPCHVSLHKPRCKGCRKPIIDEEFLTALRAKWHVGCFCCERCKLPIDSDNFFVRDNCAYDEECYKIKLRSEL